MPPFADGAGKLPLQAIPSGMWALTRIAAFHQRSVDPLQLMHTLGMEQRSVGVSELLLACNEMQLKAREAELDWEELGKLKMPAIVELVDGEFGIVGRTRGERISLTRRGTARPELYDRETWQQIYAGRAVVVNERLSFSNPNRPFGFGWFVPVLWKFRRDLGEVLMAAFFFQLLGIGLPLFVQVIIDKVFVYDRQSTLVVISAGMLAVILFSGLFGILQSVLLAHAGNRIDVTLGSALYRRLVRIPLRYFEQRRVGDTTARVREIEHIRGFLTGQALLSVIDGLFVFVYLTLLFFYSAPLTLVVLAAMLLIGLTTAAFRPAVRARLEERFDTGADSQAFPT